MIVEIQLKSTKNPSNSNLFIFKHEERILKPTLQQIVKDYFEGLLSLIFPERCVICDGECYPAKYLCFRCEEELHYTYFEKYQQPTFADELFYGRIQIERVFSLLYYEKGNSSQQIIHHIKYRKGKKLGVFMGRKLGEKLKLFAPFSDVEAIIPVPLHPKKAFIRGYNQSLMIAQGVSEVTQIPIVETLYRKTHDASQTNKSKEERYRNVKDKFEANHSLLKGKKHVVIIDDVLTTGATLEFAARALLKCDSSIRISIVTLAIAH